MGFLDALFGRREIPDIRIRNADITPEPGNINGKEVIAMDPERNQSRNLNRPPIIFENGII